jgi:hypothetical protein
VSGSAPAILDAAEPADSAGRFDNKRMHLHRLVVS